MDGGGQAPPGEGAEREPLSDEGAEREPLTDEGAELRGSAAGAPRPGVAATPAEARPAPPVGLHDPTRRAFFRELGRQAITTVGQVAALTDVVGRSTNAAASLLGVDLRDPARPARPTPLATPRLARTPGGASPRPGSGAEGYRSPYRLEGDALRILDQRRIPEALEEVTCRRGSDVAYYLRIGACRGGPLMAQVAAYGLALTAQERQEQPLAARVAENRRTRNALLAARPSSRLLAWAVGRMEAAEAGCGEEADGRQVAVALRAEADAIASRLQLDHAAIARHLAELLLGLEAAGPASERPLTVLLHGDPGALWGGLVGPGIAALSRITESGGRLRTFVTETRPFLEGARLAAWELGQAGLPHEIVPDGAVAWLLGRERVDGVLIGAEWITAGGDVAGVLGSRGVALLASAERDGEVAGLAGGPIVAGPLVIAFGSSATIDLGTPDGAAVPSEQRPARESRAYQLGTSPTASVLAPATDVIPAGTISVLVTELGATTAPSREAVAAAAAPREEAAPS